MDNLRQQRKIDHIQHALKLQGGPNPTGFSDVHFVHQALLKDNWENINTKIKIMNKELNLPILINAITGGAESLKKINSSLAVVSNEMGIAMAVGSQTIAIHQPEVKHTFTIVRKKNPNGLILANVSGLVKPEVAKAAVEMLEADCLQLHLNGPQEILMKEGDRDFSRLEENLCKIKEAVSVPIIIKEVGFGLSKEAIEKLVNLGFDWIDIGGAGGTNFLAIESERANIYSDLLGWGIPTAISLVETTLFQEKTKIICTGGIYSGVDTAKALALGASMVGFAGAPLRILVNEGEKKLIDYINYLSIELKQIMMLTGVSKISEFTNTPIVLTGFVREWLNERGIDTKIFAQRN